VKLRETLLRDDVACFVGQRAVDTLRRVKEGKAHTIDRNDVWRVQTPQGFWKSSLLAVLEKTEIRNPTDEIMLFEDSEVPTIALETSPLNQKITYPSDLKFFQQYLRTERRIGIGEDSHAFDTKGELVMGGFTIAELPKLKGNSDADVLLHALFNAISSALSEGSIGPTADPMCEDGITDSIEYLKKILQKMEERDYVLDHLSISLECLKPKVEPIAEQLKESLSKILELDPLKIGITATSGEKLSSFGKGEGIRCSCIVSLSRY